MPKHILIIQGHPDASEEHFCHALTESYEAGAKQAGHEVRQITVAKLDFPLLRTQEDFNTGSPPPEIVAAQQDIAWAEHLVIVYPLWLGTMPAMLKGFLEQVFRPQFAFQIGESSASWTKKLKGKSARVVITMGAPAIIYRWYFGAHSLKSLERNILGFCGIGPIRESLIGMIGAKKGDKRRKWLERMVAYGAEGR
jgi:putative NADPH-quinone reductase